jgi:hypothetical protein
MFTTLPSGADQEPPHPHSSTVGWTDLVAAPRFDVHASSTSSPARTEDDPESSGLVATRGDELYARPIIGRRGE